MLPSDADVFDLNSRDSCYGSQLAIWDRLVVIFDVFQILLDLFLGSFWAHLKSSLVTLGTFEVSVLSFWDHFLGHLGVILGHFPNVFDFIAIVFWGHFGVCLRSTWVNME